MGLPSPDSIHAKTPTAAEGLPVLHALQNEEPDQACIEAFGHERHSAAAATQTPFGTAPFKDGFWPPRRSSGSLPRTLELQGMASVSLDSPRGKEEGMPLVAAARGREGDGGNAVQDAAGPLLPRRHVQGTESATLRDRESSWTGDWLFAGRRALQDARSAAQQYTRVGKEDSGPS